MAIHRSQFTIGKRLLKDTVAPFANFDQLKVLLLCTVHDLFQMDDHARAQIFSRCTCDLFVWFACGLSVTACLFKRMFSLSKTK